MNPKVAIIILNWNGWEDTIECLESVYQITYPLYEVIVVDNGSKDNSIEKIQSYAEGNIKVESKFFDFSQENKPICVKEYSKDGLESSVSTKATITNTVARKNLILIKNDDNYGFAEGNNIGIKFALNKLNSDFVLLLNNDVVVDHHFLNELINVAENDSHIGILGPTVYDYRPPYKIQSAGTKIYWSLGEAINRTSRENKSSDKPEEVDSVIGCALLARSELFHKIGYLNKDYFAYLEETEWCVRAHKASYRIVYVPKGKIWHKGGATSNKITGFYLYHYTRNKFWFMKKHSSKNQYISFLIYYFGFRMWVAIGGILYRQKNKEIFPSFISFLKGIRDGIMV
jgi:GT2 family glycosyltransferase